MTGIFFKLGGAACIMSAAVWLGESKARVLGQRVRQLQLFQQSLKLLAGEVVHAHSILPLAFQRVSRQASFPVNEIYSTAAEMLGGRCDLTARQAWDTSLEQVTPKTSFTEKDLEVIRTLGISLGETRREGQLSQIELTLKRLECMLNEAQEDRTRNERMWRYLGLTGGAALVILLL